MDNLNLQQPLFCKLPSRSFFDVNIIISRTNEFSKQTWFLLAKKQSNRRFLIQIDDFDQDTVFGNAASERREIIVVNAGTNDRDFTVSTSSNNIANNESTVSVQTLERCLSERIDRERRNNVDTAEDRIQNAILTDLITSLPLKLNLQSCQ